MSATFTDALPVTATSRYSAFTWCPYEETGRTTGTLTIHTDRTDAVYAVAEFGTRWEGRAFALTKVEGGSDQESGNYDVFISARDRNADVCDCKGFAFGRGKPCKHVEAM